MEGCLFVDNDVYEKTVKELHIVQNEVVRLEAEKKQLERKIEQMKGDIEFLGINISSLLCTSGAISKQMETNVLEHKNKIYAKWGIIE